MKLTVFMTVIIIYAASIALADTISIGNFSADGLSGWSEKSFKGATEYKLVKEGKRAVVKAYSRGSASGLFKKAQFDPARYRYLRWSWKIGATIKNGDERTKAGDDYAARVYVIFPGRFFWQMKAINYIWSNRLSKGEYVPNAFSANAMMLAVESGPDSAGTWISEERDLLADYRRLFGEEPREIGAIAIMTDTDNTGGEATAWYGDITLSTAP
jgi:hypothetical protein